MMMKAAGPMFLIVDNNTWVVRLTKWRLEQLLGSGIKVIMGSSGEDAINLFKDIIQSGSHSKLQLVLVGCHMPIYTGMQAVEEMRNLEKINKVPRPVEIVGTTVDLNDEVRSEFHQAGADIVLTKPVPEGELEDLVSAIMLRRASAFQK